MAPSILNQKSVTSTTRPLFPDRATGKQETGGCVGPWVYISELLRQINHPVSTDLLLNKYGTREQQIKGGKQRPKTSYNNLKSTGGSMR
jgi:hypothetical protein